MFELRATGGRRLRLLLLLGVAASCTLVLVLLGARVRAGDSVAWEHRLRAASADFAPWLDARSDRTDDALGYLIVYASDPIALVAVAAVSAMFVAAGRIRDATVIILAAVAAVALVYVLKAAFDRPSGGPYAKYELPSGHATRSMLAAGLVVAVAWKTRWRWPAVAGGAFFVAAVTTSLVYEDWHLASDIVGGWALASAALSAAWALILLLSDPGLPQREVQRRGVEQLGESPPSRAE